MKTALCIVLLGLCAAGASGDPSAAAERARIPDDENSCIQCHAQLTEKDQERLLIDVKKFAGDSHWKKGLRCQDCHGGDATMFEVKAHQANDDFRVVKSPEDARAFCGKCHAPQAQQIAAGVHHQAGPKNKQGQATPLACGACHGPNSHDILPAREGPLKIRSPKFFELQEKTCGGCHDEDLQTYKASIHGQGLSKNGLLVVPACADCHGSHGVYLAVQQESTLHSTRVAHTCGTCHRGIEEQLQKSVHGRGSEDGGVEAGGRGTRTAPGGDASRKPSCADCHQGHDLPDPKSASAPLASTGHCGSCHAGLSAGYAISMHGALTELGYGPAAKCSDCHGAHDVLSVSTAASQLSARHPRNSCEKCHPDAAGNFLDFDPHADHRDADRDAVLHGVYLVLMTLLLTTFGGFGLHSLLWFVRGLIDVVKNGRPQSLVPGAPAYVRFGPFHRVAHTVMVLSFLGLALTGLPLKYSHHDWAQVLAGAFGGFESTGRAHRIFAGVNIGCLVVYAFRLLGRLAAGPPRGGSRLGMILGPDSPVPNLRDFKDAFKMVRWFFGLGAKPTFERWSYWEKFDFWGACADIVIIGATGLVLWFPDLACAYLPGKALNIAKVIHSTQALLATGFVFSIHFFNTHVRPEKFPMDMSILTGRVSEEELHEERPEYLERMRREGKLEQLKSQVPPREVLCFAALGGTVALFAGLSLLAGILLAALGG